jgi:hypothetical protein
MDGKGRKQSLQRTNLSTMTITEKNLSEQISIEKNRNVRDTGYYSCYSSFAADSSVSIATSIFHEDFNRVLQDFQFISFVHRVFSSVVNFGKYKERSVVLLISCICETKLQTF